MQVTICFDRRTCVYARLLQVGGTRANGATSDLISCTMGLSRVHCGLPSSQRTPHDDILIALRTTSILNMLLFAIYAVTDAHQ